MVKRVLICKIVFSNFALPSPYRENMAILNTELNDLRKNICLRKSEVSVERISVCNAIENLAEHGINCLPCSWTNNINNMFPS